MLIRKNTKRIVNSIPLENSVNLLKKVFLLEKIFLLLLCIISVNFILSNDLNAVTTTKEKKFTKGGIEHHFLLNAVIPLSEKDMKHLPAQIAEQMAPLYKLDPSLKFTKHKKGMYVDTSDRVFRRNNMILRVRKGLITLKARGDRANDVVDLEQCNRKKYEYDLFDKNVYSISSDITFKKDEFDISLKRITLGKLFSFMQQKCPSIYKYLAPIASSPRAVIPGVTSQYSFKITLNDPRYASKLDFIDFDIWFFPPTGKMVIELSYTGRAKHKKELEELYKITRDFLKRKGLLHPVQISKTEAYFRAYFN